MDTITFDFENKTVSFCNKNQRGTEIDVDLPKKKAAILAAAGYKQVDLRKEIINLLKENGLDNISI